MNRRRIEEEYAALLGPDALERQKRAAGECWGCCGEPRSGPHHEACRLYDPDPPPEIHPDQETIQ